MSKTVKHIAFLKFKADRTAEQIAEVFRIIEDLPKKIPGVLSLTWAQTSARRASIRAIRTASS